MSPKAANCWMRRRKPPIRVPAAGLHEACRLAPSRLRSSVSAMTSAGEGGEARESWTCNCWNRCFPASSRFRANSEIAWASRSSAGKLWPNAPDGTSEVLGGMARFSHGNFLSGISGVSRNKAPEATAIVTMEGMTLGSSVPPGAKSAPNYAQTGSSRQPQPAASAMCIS